MPIILLKQISRVKGECLKRASGLFFWGSQEQESARRYWYCVRIRVLYEILKLTAKTGLLVLLVIPVFYFCFCTPLLAHTQLYFLFPVANSFPDRLVMFVLQKLENSNERSRVGSLAVLRHLINSSSEKRCINMCWHRFKTALATMTWFHPRATVTFR